MAGMRRGYKHRVIVVFWIILVVLLVAWWIGEGIYKPYPPPTPTATGYWPTRITATIVPSATPTKVVPTPIQPTIGYTATPYEPPVTVTATPTVLITIKNTATPIPIVYPIQKSIEYECVTYFIRPWGIKKVSRCWLPPIALTPTMCADCVIWWPPIPLTPPFTVMPIPTGTQIFIP